MNRLRTDSNVEIFGTTRCSKKKIRLAGCFNHSNQPGRPKAAAWSLHVDIPASPPAVMALAVAKDVAASGEQLPAGCRFPSWARSAVCLLAGLLAGFSLALPQLRSELWSETFQRPTLRNGAIAPLDDAETSVSRDDSKAEHACPAANDMLVRAALGPWANVTAVDVEAAAASMRGEAGIDVLVREGQVYILHEQTGFQTRNAAAKLMLWTVSQLGLGNITSRFAVNTQDRPHSLPAPDVPLDAPLSARYPGGALMSYSRKAGGGDILIPEWGYVSWPEVHHGSWRDKHASVLAAGAARPWANRTAVALFAGSQLGNEMRVRAKALALQSPNLMTFTSGVSNEEQCGHKYLVYLEGGGPDGGAFSSRLKYLLLCGSTVLIPTGPQGPWLEWFVPALQAGVHYVPFREDATDLGDVITSLQRNDTAAERIGSAGRDVARDLLSFEGAMCFLRDLIREYSARQTGPPPLPPDAALVPVQESLLIPPA